MYILAGDTTGKTSSVAILQEERVLVELNQYLGLTHSETFFPMIEDALRQARLTMADIDVFSCTTGPGSFTGTRIGVTAMKTLAFVNQKTLLGIDTLQAMAEPYFRWQKQAVVCSSLAARNRRVFTALFAEAKYLQEACVLEVLQWQTLLQTELDAGKHVYLVGDGHLELNKTEMAELSQNEKVTLIPSAFISAASIGRLAWQRFARGEKDDVATLQPQYLVVTQAERTTGIHYQTGAKDV